MEMALPKYPSHYEHERKTLHWFLFVICDELRYLSNPPAKNTNHTQCQRDNISGATQAIAHVFFCPLRTVLVYRAHRHWIVKTFHFFYRIAHVHQNECQLILVIKTLNKNAKKHITIKIIIFLQRKEEQMQCNFRHMKSKEKKTKIKVYILTTLHYKFPNKISIQPQQVLRKSFHSSWQTKKT